MQRLYSHIGVISPLLFFVALLLIFSLERLVIRLLLPEFFADSTLSQTLAAMFVGLRFDIVIAATLASPLQFGNWHFLFFAKKCLIEIEGWGLALSR